tara:strand:- start:709 stop:1617 length:909 start_codon:yes stop_codon:yes gene_type:complete
MEVNTFLVGASKSGTTSLSNILSDHPEICMCPIKEPNYFSDDLPQDVFSESHANNLDEYHKLWTNLEKGHSLVCEASVGYFYSENAAQNIRNYNPRAKILVILRHPLRRLVSAHALRLNSGNEDVDNVVEAYKLDAPRMNGESLPKGCSNFRPYRKMMDYPSQIERYLEAFGKSQVHIVIMEDLVNDRARELERLWGFLDVSKREIRDLPHQNKRKGVRSKIALSVMSPNSFLVRRLYVPLRRFRIVKWFGGRIRRLNLKQITSSEFGDDDREYLENEFREMVSRTESITGIDLKSRWSGFS